MAQVYDSFSLLPGRRSKKTLGHLVARHFEVQNKLDVVTNRVASRARTLLAWHEYDGDSEILVTRGRIDRYVVLSDEKGLRHALSIEYGREPDEKGKGGMAGLFILHRAAQIRKRR